MQVVQETSKVTSLYPNGPERADPPTRIGRPISKSSKLPAHRDIKAITCFTPGTGIATKNGAKLVEQLRQGDRILTRDRGFQPVRWIGKRQVSFSAALHKRDALPVMIRADALGAGRPERDIIVSPRHRILTSDRSYLSIMGESEALIEARALVGRPGITCVMPEQLTYIHLLFDQHEIILSDHLWSESFYLGRPAVAALLREQCNAIKEIFPQIDTAPNTSPQMLARVCLTHEEVQMQCA
ncbi:Hint domain-containing protein [Roseovarius aestuarii]|uniref:Hedgehog/Intein (Hint) domain-containing protein n=1 Tax=Roseovarius aestuarii TaxID=475083 RepID=A0A1X7BW05_9RHOB|nr:Hint domain-containing protein [Roseovarius aestuarii]SMC13774.1 hypothetical protein ROA7745_03633 [Roseovarius aestuarii]